MNAIKAYYGSRFSPNMTETPEGYLICHSVPIARAGYQDYRAPELGLPGGRDTVIGLYRPEEEVFSDEALASFEGKPVTDDHPREDVQPDNWSRYAKGVCNNVHRGSGADADKVLADLIIYDAALQREIESGKREVSCGYDYIRDETGDQLVQRRIRGNHVAIVKTGRAGHAVAIRDENTLAKEHEKMSKPTKKNIMGKMFKAFAVDAEPEEVACAMDILAEPEEEETAPVTVVEEKATDEGNEALAQVLAKLEGIESRLTALENPTTADADPLSGLEQELSDTSVTSDTEETVTIPAEEVGEKTVSVATDSQTLLSVVRALKPTIAELPIEQRQKAADSISTAIRLAIGKPVQVANSNDYGDMLNSRQAKDAQVIDDRAIEENYNKKNPHYKEGK